MVNWLCTEVTIFKQIPLQYHEELYMLFWVLQGVIKSAAELEPVAREIRKLPPTNNVAIYLVGALNKADWVKRLYALRDPRFRPLYHEFATNRARVPEDKILVGLESQFKNHHPEFVLGFVVGSESGTQAVITPADERVLSRHTAALSAVAASKRPV